MNTKEYILKLLGALEGKWAPASGLKLLIEGEYLSEDLINHLASIFQKSINETQDSLQKTTLQKSLSFVQKLKNLEQQQQAQEAKELADIDTMLKTF